MVNLCQRTRRKEMTCFFLLIIMEFSISTLQFVKIFLCQLTRWKERNMIGNITRLYLSISLPRMPKTCKMNMYFHWVKYLYLSVSLPCMPRTCEIIEDYDRMIRIILLTTIPCTHLDIVHSSQYV